MTGRHPSNAVPNTVRANPEPLTYSRGPPGIRLVCNLARARDLREADASSPKNAALRKVGLAAEQPHEVSLLKNSTDRDGQGMLRGEARKAALTATPQAAAAARRAGATGEEIRASRSISRSAGR